MRLIDKIHLEIRPYRGEFSFPESLKIDFQQQKDLSGIPYYPCYHAEMDVHRGVIKPGHLAEKINTFYSKEKQRVFGGLSLPYIQLHNPYRIHKTLYYEVDRVPEYSVQRLSVPVLDFDSQGKLSFAILEAQRWLQQNGFSPDLASKILYADIANEEDAWSITDMRVVPFLAFEL